MITSCQILNSVGLGLDILGVVVIWIFGIPNHLAYKGVQIRIKEETRAKQERYRKISHLGLILLIAGFLFQLASNWYG